MSYETKDKIEASEEFLNNYLDENGKLPKVDPKLIGARYLWRDIEKIRLDEMSQLERLANVRFV